MPRTIETNWNYFPKTGHIVGSDLKGHEKEFLLGDPDETCKIYELTPNTKFDHQVWNAWWDKKPIAISYKENPDYHITIGKIELVVFKATSVDSDARTTRKTIR